MRRSTRLQGLESEINKRLQEEEEEQVAQPPTP